MERLVFLSHRASLKAEWVLKKNLISNGLQDPYTLVREPLFNQSCSEPHSLPTGGADTVCFWFPLSMLGLTVD